MEHYEVRMTHFAEDAMREIGQYITVNLQSPQAAIKIFSLLRREIKALEYLPSRFPLTEEEPWRSEGVRKMPVKNFLVYYWINEERKTVQIIHIVYAGRDQKTQLASIPKE